jgi:hypothetical protein
MRKQESHFNWERERRTVHSSEWPSTSCASLLSEDEATTEPVRRTRSRAEGFAVKIVLPLGFFLALAGVGVQALARLLHG